MKITVLYDNRTSLRGWKAGWGFSCVVQSNNSNILFDTGGNGNALLNNMEKSDVDLNNIDSVTFSHYHWDHVGGAEEFLKKNKSALVFVPESFPETFLNMIKLTGHEYKLTGSEYTELVEGVFTTKSYGSSLKLEEQGLVLLGKKGLALITGCAHPGILFMVKEVKRFFNQDVKLIFGGFHLKGLSKNKSETLIQELIYEGVKYFLPCHCTGDIQIEIFRKICGKNYTQIGCGTTFTW